MPVDGEIDRRHSHFGEMGVDAAGQLVTSGLYGWTMAVTGDGPSVAQAKSKAYARVRRVTVPNLRYRHDIGDGPIVDGYQEVERLGLLDL